MFERKTVGTGEYNVAVWRIQDGAVISVQAAELHDGKVVRAAGTWSHDNGTEAYHEPFVRDVTSFCGRPCEVVVTRGPRAVLDAVRMPMAKAYEQALRAGVVARFGGA